MSDRREEDLAALAYPGFVDILSSVVIMFVFFLMITATALYFHTIIFKSKILNDAEIQIKAAIKQPDSMDLKREIKRLMEANKDLKEEMRIQKQKKLEKEAEAEDYSRNKKSFMGARMAESHEQSIDISPNGEVVTIYFGKSAVTLAKNIQKEVQDFISRNKDNIATGEYKLIIKVGKPINVPTENVAKELAVARMFNIRNEALKIKGFPVKIISAYLSNPKKIKKTYNWATITIKKIKKKIK